MVDKNKLRRTLALTALIATMGTSVLLNIIKQK